MGVWREYFRVRVSIPLDVPLKRRMKLKKSNADWSWVYFKYEGIPTFCFICGLVGHSDKFCEKLFDASMEAVEKPYGTWMRADHRRRSHTMGSKWLKPGGATAATGATAKESDSVDTINHATMQIDSGILGTEKGRTDQRSKNSSVYHGDQTGLQDKSKNQFQLFQESVSTMTEENIEGDNIEIIVSDPKRRRKAHETTSPDEEMNQSPDVENENQKNLLMAGAAM